MEVALNQDVSKIVSVLAIAVIFLCVLLFMNIYKVRELKLQIKLLEKIGTP